MSTRALLLLASCLLVKAGGIEYTQPVGVKCGEKVTVQVSVALLARPLPSVGVLGFFHRANVRALVRQLAARQASVKHTKIAH